MAQASQTMARQRPTAKQKKSPSFLYVLLASLTVLVWLAAFALVGGILAYQYNYEGRIFEGVSMRGINLSGMTLQEAEDRLRVAFDPYPLMPIVVRYEDQTWNLSAKDLGVNFDAVSAAQAAYRVGRDAPAGAAIQSLREVNPDVILAKLAQIQSNLQEQLNAYRFGHEVLAQETVDRTAGLIWLQQQAREIDRPVVEASLRVDGLDVTATRSQPGYALDVTTSHQAMYDALLANEGEVVELVVRENEPLLADVSQAEVFVRQVFNGPIMLVAPDPDLDTSSPPPSYTISAEQLAPLVGLETLPQLDGTLEVKASLDVQPLRSQVSTWALDLAREPREARLDFDPKTGEVSVVTPSQIGRALDVDATMEAIYQAALSPDHNAELPLRLIEPAVNMHRIDEMGIKEVVARGTTSFKGSSADRVHNIKTGAAAVQGIVVPPDGVFSFNDAVGNVDAEHGYKDSLIIWGDRTAVGIGGGICQVSTTVFRAAYYGGLPIEERYNHGYVVGWYGQPGLDATIYTPTVDFKFRNNTGHYLLIESEVDEAKGTLTFILYGTKPDWTVEVTGPEVSNEVPPGKPVYQEDPGLATGEVKQVEWSNRGLDVVWKRVIKDAQGQVISSEDLRSKYSPWSAYYLVGPGTPIPEGAEFRPASAQQTSG